MSDPILRVRRSVLRTARLHKEGDRANRIQHRRPLTFDEKIRGIKSGTWKGEGYHACMCRACLMARVYWSRQIMKEILDDFKDWNQRL